MEKQEETKIDITKCKCGSKGTAEHQCPFNVEIHDDTDFLCNCCDDCEYECCMDI